MKWLEMAWGWLSKLPIGRWLGRAVKPVAVELVKAECDKLRTELMSALRTGKDFDKVFDAFQSKTKSGIWLLKMLSARQREFACKIVQDEGDRLQGKVSDAIKIGGPAAVGPLFDAFEDVIIQRIQGL